MNDGTLTRPVISAWKAKPTMEGAGVRLLRAFGNAEALQLDPFLLLDAFHSDNPDDYKSGFPWHPHRGIETITYLLDGEIEHADSLGNKGLITSGDVQWMTAGSGIIHQEMPLGDRKGRMAGFQLWSNLPARGKMMDPRYREVKSAEIPIVKTSDGATIRVIAGEVDGVTGPVKEVVTDPLLLDVSLAPFARATLPAAVDHSCFAYVIEGEAAFDAAQATSGERSGADTLVRFGGGGSIVVTTDARPARFLLVAGRPLEEPVAWAGPIVMNTKDELRTAFRELDEGSFVRHPRA